MGFSQVAVAALIAGSALFLGGQFAKATFESDNEVQQAWADAEAIKEARRNALVEITVFSWNNGQDELTLDIQNTGSMELDVSELVFVIDGVIRTSITSSAVDGDASNGILYQGSTLVIVLDLAPDYPGAAGPDDALVVTEHGTMNIWRDQ